MTNTRPQDGTNDRRAWTYKEWLAMRGIPVGTAHRHKDLMPKRVKIGRRQMVLAEEDERWAREHLRNAEQPKGGRLQ